ncbi:MAG: hypothetical protein AUH14_11130 [Candidatus Rokubacteria bacterium 13_2_20CM_69_15_1]|nr:MAG: hypothetical protein AUH14_11130 [Candidatus Rokubacteria bacterium 13_2_20CM_69_15_1]
MAPSLVLSTWTVWLQTVAGARNGRRRVIGAERARPVERRARVELRVAPGDDLHVLRQHGARVEPFEERALVLGGQHLALAVGHLAPEREPDDERWLADLGRPEIGGANRYRLDATHGRAGGDGECHDCGRQALRHGARVALARPHGVVARVCARSDAPRFR